MQGVCSRFISKSMPELCSGCSSKSLGLVVAPLRSAPYRTALRHLAPTRRENTTTVHTRPPPSTHTPRPHTVFPMIAHLSRLYRVSVGSGTPALGRQGRHQQRLSGRRREHGADLGSRLRGHAGPAGRAPRLALSRALRRPRPRAGMVLDRETGQLKVPVSMSATIVVVARSTGSKYTPFGAFESAAHTMLS